MSITTSDRSFGTAAPVKLSTLFSNTSTVVTAWYNFAFTNQKSSLMGSAGYIQYLGPDVDYTVNAKTYSLKTGQKFDSQLYNVAPSLLENLFYIPGSYSTSQTLMVSGNINNIDSGWSRANFNTVTITRSVGIGGAVLDRTFTTGSLLGIDNSRTFGPTFFGLNIPLYMSNTFRNRYIGLTVNTERGDRLKLGVQATAGYGLGSVRISGGIRGNVSYDSSRGISLSSMEIISPSLNVESPYAFANLALINQLKLNPHAEITASLNLWFFTLRGTLDFDRFLPKFNINRTTTLLNYDTRNNIRFSEFLPQKLATPTINSTLWNSAYTNGISPITYGYQGKNNIANYKVSLSQILPTPLGFDLRLDLAGIGARLYGNVIDASLSFKSDFNWNFSASIKSNMYYTIEGSSTKYELKAGDNSWQTNYRDLNNDNKIDINTYFNPVINLRGEAYISNQLGWSLDILEAGASVYAWGAHAGFDVALFRTGNIPLTPAANISLLNFDKTFDLFSVDPSLGIPSTSNPFAQTTQISIA